MAVEKQSRENADLGTALGVGAANDTRQPENVAPVSDLSLPMPAGPPVGGQALADALGVGKFAK